MLIKLLMENMLVNSLAEKHLSYSFGESDSNKVSRFLRELPNTRIGSTESGCLKKTMFMNLVILDSLEELVLKDFLRLIFSDLINSISCIKSFSSCLVK